MPFNFPILLPMFALAAWTFLVLLRLAVVRLTSGVHPREFRYGESSQVPPTVILPNRNYMNLLELPMLFYVACLLLCLVPAPLGWALPLAWLYVGLRIAHSLVHLTYNNVFHRLAVFAASNFVLMAIWVCAWRGLSRW